ncbi:hypothetical protein EPO56_00795 [Patescibacteria group bacterium]|nr:MAG: hypothetical protein EPO56_00795 [Patescibacteria group bacterium]
MMKIDKKIIEKIQSLDTPTIISISGFGGSGKSTFAKLLGSEIQAPVICVDSFSRDSSASSLWDSMDFERLKKEVLLPFINGENPIFHGHYDSKLEAFIKDIRVEHRDRLIIEGVGLFRPELMNYFSYTIWIDCPLEEAIERGIKRDREIHKNPQDEKWNGVWKKNDLEYFESFNPKTNADLVVDNY